MDTTLLVAIFAAMVTVIGWLVAYSTEKRRQRLIFQREFIKQQLEELYGPLAFLVLEGKQTYQDLVNIINRDDKLERGNVFPENELKVWLFWIETDFFPRNQKIKELLSSKTHLIEGGMVPQSFLQFLDHYNSWQINHKRWQQQGVEYGWRSKVAWPGVFEKEVLSTFDNLKKRHSLLIGMISENANWLRPLRRKLH